MGRVELGGPSPPGKYPEPHLGEQLRLGEREIYIFYGDGMADSRLRIPGGNAGTARNMNTIAKLVEIATGL
jgi:hypothetical protein